VKGGLGREGVKHVGLHTNHGWMLVIFIHHHPWWMVVIFIHHHPWWMVVIFYHECRFINIVKFSSFG
jgi:hypothetical protein